MKIVQEVLVISDPGKTPLENFKLKYCFCDWYSNVTLFHLKIPWRYCFRWFRFDCPEIRISLFLPEKNDQVTSRFSYKLTLCLLYRQVLLYLYAQHRTLKYKSIDKFLFRQNQVVLDFRVRASDKKLVWYLPIS